MTSLWLAVAMTCLRKDWFGHVVLIGVGVATYPSFSVLLVLLCVVVVVIVASVRIAFTFLYIRSKFVKLPADQRAAAMADLDKFCAAHVQGVFS